MLTHYRILLNSMHSTQYGMRYSVLSFLSLFATIFMAITHFQSSSFQADRHCQMIPYEITVDTSNEVDICVPLFNYIISYIITCIYLYCIKWRKWTGKEPVRNSDKIEFELTMKRKIATSYRSTHSLRLNDWTYFIVHVTDKNSSSN